MAYKLPVKTIFNFCFVGLGENIGTPHIWQKEHIVSLHLKYFLMVSYYFVLRFKISPCLHAYIAHHTPR